jgi:uncharacterized delta-60 repeat protein
MRRLVAAAAAACALASPAPAGALGPGDLDPSFGPGGTQSCGEGDAAAMLVQDAQRTVLAGSAPGAGGTDTMLCRLTADGRLDASFGVEGRVITPIASGALADEAGAITRGWRGRLIVAGVARIGPDPNVSDRLYLSRYNLDGTLDSSFADAGVRILDLPVDRVLAVGMGSYDSRITVLARDGHALVLARLFYGGTLDSEYGNGGTSRIPVGFEPLAGTVLQWGGAVAAGEADTPDPRPDPPNPCCWTEWRVVRATDGGNLDRTFSDDGFAQVTIAGQDGPAEPADLVEDARYNVVIVGKTTITASNFEPSTALARLTYAGVPDPTFGQGGTLLINVAPWNYAPAWDWALAVDLAPDGRIVVAGRALNFRNSGWAATVLRLERDASEDTGFGYGGVALPPFEEASDVAVQGTTGILVRSGTTVARLLGNRADLALAGTASVEVLAHLSVATFELTIANHGPDAATSLRPVLPQPTGANSHTVEPARCLSGGRDADCSLDRLAPGERLRLRVHAYVERTVPSIEFRPSVSSLGALDPGRANNALQILVPMLAPP